MPSTATKSGLEGNCLLGCRFDVASNATFDSSEAKNFVENWADDRN